MDLKDLKNDLYGINIYFIKKGLLKLGISFDKLYYLSNIKLSKKEYLLLINYLKNKILFGSELEDKIFIDIRKQILLKTYKGLRHSYSLPVNGQRTKTNAKTRKKKKK